MSTDTDEVSELAQEVVQELDPGTIIKDRVILSRRQMVGLATGALSIGALTGVGAESASAQAAGQVGTSTDRIDVLGYDVDAGNSLIDPSGTSHTGELADADDVTSTSVTGGYEVTINGDTYQFNK